MPARRFIISTFVLLGLLLLVSLFTPVTYAAGFVVTKTADTSDGTCDADCSLREAITAANANTPVADTITFNIPDADSGCVSANVCTILLGSALPAIDDELTIDGAPNNADITVSGANVYQVLQVNSGKTLTVNALTIEKGACSACHGGGIYSAGTLKVNNSTFTGNAALRGGGIYNDNGAALVTNSTFIGNNATYGAGMYNYQDSAIVANSTFTSNSAAYGGGFDNFLGTADLTNSTFSANSASFGGGVLNDNATTVLANTIIANSTSGTDCYVNAGSLLADGSNIDHDGSCGNAMTKTTAEIALQGPAENGGPTLTMALGSTSAALDAAVDSLCAAAVGYPTYGAGGKDQRGVTRPATDCDIGAFELIVCSAGFYFDGSSCVPAPKGYFVDAPGATAPSPCPPGTYQPSTGQTSCLNADPGYYVPVQASIAQTQCPSGTNSAAAAVACYQTGPNFVVNASADDDDGSCDVSPSDCTLREAINAANDLAGADTITFDIPASNANCTAANSCTILLDDQLGSLPAIDDTLTMDGSANDGHIEVSGATKVRVMDLNSGKTLNLNALTIKDGSCGTSCDGGGIANAGGTLNVTNSTFVNNAADGGGGGAIFNGGATLTLTNSTIANNPGGGILNNGGTVNVINSTIAGNTLNGISTVFGNTTLRNTIVTGTLSGLNCTSVSSTFTADAFNLSSDVSCIGATHRTAAEIDLQNLAENGGPTPTLALSNSSIAIDFADNTVCAAAVGSPTFGADGHDQRGEARDDLQCDAGAFEFVSSDGNTILKNNLQFGPLYTFGPTLAGVTAGSFYSPTLTISRNLVAPGNTPPANALPITWDAAAAGGTYSFLFTLCYDPGVLAGQDESTLHVWHYNGSTWDDLGGTLDTTTHAPLHCVTATTALSSLSPLILAPANPTAVDVAGLRAERDKQGRAVLKWQTTSEAQIAGFTVYRRAGKQEWKPVKNGFVQAKNGGDAAGKPYHFKVKKINAAKTYRFKLQVHYLDNHTEWTDVVKLGK